MKKYDFMLNKKEAVFDYIKKDALKIGHSFFSVAICVIIYLTAGIPELINFLFIYMTVVLIINAVSIICYAFSSKGVWLYDDHIEYKTYNSKTFSSKIKINYKDIVDISASDKETLYKSNKNKYIVPCGDNEHYVKVLSKYGNEYLLPIADKDGFINDVLIRCNAENK